MSEPGPLMELIRREIAARGAIPFARFMELALYAPGLGYYERAEPVIGRRGDFYTSVSVGSLFGELLAFQFAGWAAEGRGEMPDAGCQMPVQIVEAGAHDGRLGADILGWLRERRGDLFDVLEYWIVEPSARRRAWQEKALGGFAPRVCWAEMLGQVPKTGYRVLFCNELLDAFPVHRLGWDAKAQQWFEWSVDWDGEHFVWQRTALLPVEANAPAVAFRFPPSALQAVLPDGYTIEVSPAAERWWREAATTLTCGKLLCFDYGLSEDELFAPERTRGTLRAYHRHHAGDDLLAAPGEQDLTAHVNYSALQRAGEAAGLRTETSLTQGQFLTGLAAKAWAAPELFGTWPPPRTRQFQTLTHPEHLGRAFRVLGQSLTTTPATPS